MRITSGERKGLELYAPKGRIARPTADKVKQAMFNAIQFEIEGKCVLDLFAGSGALGIEALSRGARFAYFVDNNPDCVSTIRRNVARAEYDEQAQIRLCGFDKFAKTHAGIGVELAFLDPPYGKNLIIDAILSLNDCNVLTDNAIIICESCATDALPSQIAGFRAGKEYSHADTRFHIFRRSIN